MNQLKSLRQWICWKLRKKDDRPTKVPCAANGGSTGTDPAHASTWVTWEEATKAAQQNGYTGVGFVIPQGYFFLDVDHRELSDPLVQTLLKRFNTFVLVCFAWIFFRANSLSDMAVLLANLTVGWGNIPATLTSMGIGITSALVAVLSIVIMSQLDMLTERNEAEGAICTKTSTVWLVWAVAIAWIMLLSVGGASSFIYFQF